ncbi:hypothetical protein JW935_00965 [candidate division KSB1 bacterium]|nr:hypothetical protein [candidate division KSB1 bacterium]
MQKHILTFSFVLSISFFNFAASGEWKLLNPPLTGNQLNDLFFITPEEGWAVGDRIILHTNDSGSTWEIQPTPLRYPPQLLSVHFLNSDTGFAVGGTYGRSYALTTENGGREWEDITDRFPTGGLVKIDLHKGKTFWVISWLREPNLYRSDDYGTTWKPSQAGTSSINDIFCIDDSTMIVCGDNAYIGKTSNGGETWEKVSENLGGLFLRFSFPGKDTGYCLDKSGNVVKTTDSGTSWERCRTNNAGEYTVIHFIDSRNGFILGGYNNVSGARTTDGGETWVFFQTDIVPQVTAVDKSDLSNGIAVAWNGAVYRFGELFDNSVEITRNTGNNLFSKMDFHSLQTGGCGAYYGDIYITNDSGITWNKKSTPSQKTIKKITFFSRKDIYISDGSDLYATSDTGNSWTPIDDIPGFISFFKLPDTESGFTYNTSTVSYVFGKDLTVEERGTFVPSNSTASNYYINAIHFRDSLHGAVATLRGQVAITNDGGYTWTEKNFISETVSINDILFFNSDTGWIAGSSTNDHYQARIFKTVDGGTSWMACTSIQFASDLSKPTDIVFTSRVIRICGKSGQPLLWALMDGGVLKSEDDGESWLQEELPQFGKVFYDMYMFENGELFVTGDHAKIWKYSPEKSFSTTPDLSKEKKGVNYRFGRLSFNLPSGIIKRNISFKILDLRGKVLFNKTIPFYDSTVQLPKLGTGCYLFTISNGKTTTIVPYLHAIH